MSRAQRDTDGGGEGEHPYAELLSPVRLAPTAADPGLSLIGSMQRTLPVLRVLEELRDATGYTVSLGALGRKDVVYIHRLAAHRHGQHEIDLELRVGARIPLYCTALGKALLAVVPEMRRRRLIYDLNFIPQGPNSIMSPNELVEELAALDIRAPVISDEEFVVGSRAIAMYVPRPNTGRPVGIDITVPSDAMTADELREQIGPSIVYAAKLIAQAEPDERQRD
ncbi:MAG: IclR family transcriptional regulator [Solirubrobacteraceae bacterium]